MSISKKLHARSKSTCELCASIEDLRVYEVAPNSKGTVEDSILACSVCIDQIENPDNVDVNHWRCLNDSMWSEVLAVQVIAWRMLTRLRSEGWPQDMLDMMYLDEEILEWAKATGEGEEEDEHKIVHRD
ncbi:MAG: PhnA protein, partial [Lutibacter sp.]